MVVVKGVVHGYVSLERDGHRHVDRAGDGGLQRQNRQGREMKHLVDSCMEVSTFIAKASV